MTLEQLSSLSDRLVARPGSRSIPLVTQGDGGARSGFPDHNWRAWRRRKYYLESRRQAKPLEHPSRQFPPLRNNRSATGLASLGRRRN